MKKEETGESASARATPKGFPRLPKLASAFQGKSNLKRYESRLNTITILDDFAGAEV